MKSADVPAACFDDIGDGSADWIDDIGLRTFVMALRNGLTVILPADWIDIVGTDTNQQQI